MDGELKARVFGHRYQAPRKAATPGGATERKALEALAGVGDTGRVWQPTAYGTLTPGKRFATRKASGLLQNTVDKGT